MQLTYFATFQTFGSEDYDDFTTALAEWLVASGGVGEVDGVDDHQCLLFSTDPTTVFAAKMRWAGPERHCSICHYPTPEPAPEPRDDPAMIEAILARIRIMTARNRS